MKRNQFFSVLAGLVLVVGILSPAFAAASRPREMCPVMPGTRVNPKYFVDYQGRRVFLCCRACVKAFQKHPERYAARLAPA